MIELNQVYCRDVLKILPSIDNESIDLIIADPPYYLLDELWDKKQFDSRTDYFEFMSAVLAQCVRVLKKTGSIYCFSDWRNVTEIINIMNGYFNEFRNWIIWERNKGRSNSHNFKSVREDILYYSKTRNFVFNEQKQIRDVIAPYRDKDGKPKGWFVDEDGHRVRWTGVGNIWHYTPPVWSSKIEKPTHSTQKPVEMMKRIISASSNEGDIVLDLFSGSGTTSYSAKALNRNFIAIENTPIFVENINKRLELLTVMERIA